MNSIQTLITELKTKLSHQARQDLDRLIQSPEAQQLLQRDEEATLSRRRELIKQLEKLPAKYQAAKVAAAKPCQAAVDRLAAAELELQAARQNIVAVRAAASTPVRGEDLERLNAERELLATCDARLAEFSTHADNARQLVGHLITVWPTHTKHYITGERNIVYESNIEEVRAAMTLLAEATADCELMQEAAISFDDVSQRLTTWTHRLMPHLEKYELPVPFVDESGAVKLETKLSLRERYEVAIQHAMGAGKRALA